MIEHEQLVLDFTPPSEVLDTKEQETGLSNTAQEFLEAARQKASELLATGMSEARAKEKLGFGRALVTLRGRDEISDEDVQQLLDLHPLPQKISAESTDAMVSSLAKWARQQQVINGEDGDVRQRAAHDK